MTAGMMLPGAFPAALRCARADSRVHAAPVFAVSYLAVWTVVGLAVYTLYRRNVRSGFEFGVYCVDSSIGLMVMSAALGLMSVTWMSVVAVLVLAQKPLPPKASIDVPLALAILTLGVVIAVARSFIPGLVPTT